MRQICLLLIYRLQVVPALTTCRVAVWWMPVRVTHQC
jgi:hypothetical protein